MQDFYFCILLANIFIHFQIRMTMINALDRNVAEIKNGRYQCLLDINGYYILN